MNMWSVKTLPKVSVSSAGGVFGCVDRVIAISVTCVSYWVNGTSRSANYDIMTGEANSGCARVVCAELRARIGRRGQWIACGVDRPRGWIACGEGIARSQG